MPNVQLLTTKVLADGFRLLEGPRWRNGRLWMSDIFDHKVYTLGPEGDVEMVVEVPGEPSGLGFLPDGTPLIVSMKDRCLFRLEGEDLVCHADLGSLVTGDLNDMVVDAQGRAYVGNIGFDVFGGEDFRPANLVMVSPTGEARVVAKELAAPNGTVILQGGEKLVIAEFFGNKLTAFDIAADGSLSNRRLFADLGDYNADGICLDQEGAIWVSTSGKGHFLRVLEGGAITHRIELTDRNAVACQLGGADGRTLFCFTSDGTWEKLLARQVRSRVEVTTVQVPGAGSP